MKSLISTNELVDAERIFLRDGLVIYRRPSSQMWYVQVQDPTTKKQIRKSTKSTGKKEAQAYAQGLWQEISAKKYAAREQKSVERKEVRKGLQIYKRANSPYWIAVIWSPKQKKQVQKSTKEVSRVAAMAVAEELFDEVRRVDGTEKVSRDRSFAFFADQLMKQQNRQAGEQRNARFAKDDEKLLLRPTDGVWEYFANQDVGNITTADIRDYLNYLDDSREKPLALSTKNKHAIIIRKVLKLAYEAREIDVIPPSPKIGTKDSPRPTFTDVEYKLLLKTARQEAKKGIKVRGVPLTFELYYFILFCVHTWIRPIETEVFALKHRDVETRDDPTRLNLHIYGKTGYRQGASTKFGVKFYEHLCEKVHPMMSEPDDFLFLPAYKNRSTAVRIINRQFNHILSVAGLKEARDGQARTPYSLRHYGLGLRLRKSEGEVNTFLLAKSAGTSVQQLERFYLKSLEMTPEQARNLQSMGRNNL